MRHLLLVASAAIACAAESAPPATPAVAITAWARATVPTAAVGAVFGSITVPAADRLTAVRCERATTIELHTMTTDPEGRMVMRPVPAIDLPAGTAVELKPGGLHVMLIGLTTPLAQGERILCTFVLERAGEVAVTATVASIDATAAPAACCAH